MHNQPPQPDYRRPPPPPGGYNQYGPPQSPNAPWPGGPQPQGRKPKGRTPIVIAVVAVLLVAAAGGVWFWQSGDGQGEGGQGGGLAADTQLSLTLEQRFPEDWKPDVSEVENTLGSLLDGAWWTEEQLIREMWNEVVAYDLADGSVAWQVPVPGNGACLASRERSPEGYVAIMRGAGLTDKGSGPCDQLTIVDTTTGKEVWTTKLEPVGAKLPTAFDRPVIAGGYVHIASETGGQSLSLQDGTPLNGQAPQSGGCHPTAYLVVDDTLMAWRNACAVAEGNPSSRVLVGYDKDLKALWAWQYPEDDKKVRLADVLSVDPLVVMVAKRSTTEVWRVTPGGLEADGDPGEHTVVTEVNPSARKYVEPCRGANKSLTLTKCTNVEFGDGVVYLRSSLDENGRRTGIVAVDLDSGDELWRAEPDAEATLQPVGLDDGKLIAYQAQHGESPGVVAAVDPKSGKLTALAGLPLGENGGSGWGYLLQNGDLNGLDWRDGRLAFVAQGVVVSQPDAGGGANSVATLVYS